MLELLHIPYSPWSEKARWALDARGLQYRSRYYQPLLGEPELRWRLKKLRGPVSVPVLFDNGTPIPDSFAIAKFAATQGAGPELVPDEQVIADWNAVSERGLAAGRALSLARVLQDPRALSELVPKSLRSALGPVAVKVASAGVRRTLKKYGATGKNLDEQQATLVDALDRLRAAVIGRDTVLAQGFSYADITMAQVLCYVHPPTSGLRLGEGNRAAFADPALAERYPELIVWRDRLYAQHRGTSGAIKS